MRIYKAFPGFLWLFLPKLTPLFEYSAPGSFFRPLQLLPDPDADHQLMDPAAALADLRQRILPPVAADLRLSWLPQLLRILAKSTYSAPGLYLRPALWPPLQICRPAFCRSCPVLPLFFPWLLFSFQQIPVLFHTPT